MHSKANTLSWAFNMEIERNSLFFLLNVRKAHGKRMFAEFRITAREGKGLPKGHSRRRRSSLASKIRAKRILLPLLPYPSPASVNSLIACRSLANEMKLYREKICDLLSGYSNYVLPRRNFCARHATVDTRSRFRKEKQIPAGKCASQKSDSYATKALLRPRETLFLSLVFVVWVARQQDVNLTAIVNSGNNFLRMNIF